MWPHEAKDNDARQGYFCGAIPRNLGQLASIQYMRMGIRIGKYGQNAPSDYYRDSKTVLGIKINT